jgi:hypothetical protein
MPMTPTAISALDEIGDNLQYVLLPSGSIVHQNGVPVRLITGALVTAAYGNMSQLIGHHLAAVPTAPKHEG